MSERLSQPNYNCKLLNFPQEEFLNASKDIKRSRGVDYRNEMQILSPGLYMHIGTQVYEIRKLGVLAGSRYVEIAEPAFNSGALMTYGLLRRMADDKGLMTPNPNFNPSDVIDTEQPEPTGKLMQAARRAFVLPHQFPHIYQTGLKMLGRILHVPSDKIDLALNTDGDRIINNPLLEGVNTLRSATYTSEYLAGVAETILPLERYAEIDNLKSLLE